MVSMTPLPHVVPRQANRNNFKRWGQAYSRRNKLSNTKAALPRQSHDPLDQWSSIKFGELLSKNESGLTHLMSGVPVEDGSSRSGLLVDMNCQSSKNLSMKSTQHQGANLQVMIFKGTPNSPSNSFSGKNRNMFLPMQDQSKSTVDNMTSSAAPTECQQHTGETNQVVATGVDSQDLENKDEAPPGLAASAGKISSSVENHNLEKGNGGVSEPDRTLPKTPCKKKHRPKVVTEGKPICALKSYTPNPTYSTKAARAKRKDERNKKTNKPSKTLTRSSKVANPSITHSAVNSFKRSLKFDLGGQLEEGGFLHTLRCNSCTQANSALAINPPDHAVRFREEEAMGKEADEGAYDLSSSTSELLKKYIQLPDKEIPKTSCVEKIPQKSYAEEIRQTSCVDEILKTSCDVEAIPYPEVGKVFIRYQRRRKMADCRAGYGRERSSTAVPVKGEHGSKRAFSTLEDKETRNLATTQGAVCSPKNLFLENREINRMTRMLFPDIRKKRRTEELWRPSNSLASSSTTIKDECPMPCNSLSAAAKSYYGNGKSFVHTWPDIQKLRKKRSKRPTHVCDIISNKLQKLVSYCAKGEIEASTNALVPFQKDDAVVPYQGPVNMKKHRAKVDLDEKL